MNWEAIGAVGELGGALVVVITLVYLATQVRQNTEQARLRSIQGVTASNDSAFNPIYIPENTRIWTKGHAHPDQLDDHEQQVFSLLMTRLLASFDATTYQFESGSFDPERYEGMAVFYSSFISTPGGSKWYAEFGGFFAAATHESLVKALDSADA